MWILGERLKQFIFTTKKLIYARIEGGGGLAASLVGFRRRKVNPPQWRDIFVEHRDRGGKGEPRMEGERQARRGWSEPGVIRKAPVNYNRRTGNGTIRNENFCSLYPLS